MKPCTFAEICPMSICYTTIIVLAMTQSGKIRAAPFLTFRKNFLIPLTVVYMPKLPHLLSVSNHLWQKDRDMPQKHWTINFSKNWNYLIVFVNYLKFLFPLFFVKSLHLPHLWSFLWSFEMFYPHVVKHVAVARIEQYHQIIAKLNAHLFFRWVQGLWCR